MLNFDLKTNMFKHLLLSRDGSYADTMKEELFFHFFENKNDLSFLNKLQTKCQVEKKVDFFVSKMIMHEHEEDLNEIIHYCL